LSPHSVRTNCSRSATGISSAASSTWSTRFQSSASIESEILVAAQFSIQPGLGFVPLAHDGYRRHLHHLGGFVNAKSTKKAQFDDLTFALINLGETFERLIERQQISIFFVGHRHGRVE